MIDLKELRWLAIASIEAEEHTNRLQDSGVYHIHPTTLQAIDKAHKDFVLTCTPEIVIELLNRLEAAEKVCEAQVKWRNSQTFQEYDLAQNECALALKAWQEVCQCADQQQKK